MKKYLFILSVTLFLISTVATLLSLKGIDVDASFNWTEFIGLGIFVTFPPCIYLMNKNKLEFPSQLKVIIVILLLFAAYCFSISFFNMTPIEKDGVYYLVNHGNQTEVINKPEYIKTRTENFLGGSSIWMLFYGISSFIYYLYLKNSLPLIPGLK